MGFTKQFQCICVFLFLIFGAWISLAVARTITLDESISESESMRERFKDWMSLYEVVYYNDIDKEMRFKIFSENVARIDSFNRDSSKPYKLAINRFADLTFKEVTASRTMNKYQKHPKQSRELSKSFRYENVNAVPSSIDWRKKGAVTSIKDQGICSAYDRHFLESWAYSAVAAIEGITQITTGKLLSLSEKMIMDCDGGSPGCYLGWRDNAFNFVKNHGITSEANYPSLSFDGSCNVNSTADIAATISGYERVPANDEAALEKAVANQPVSVDIDGGGFEFTFYSSGIFTGPCGTKQDQGVAVVGYGESSGMKYWLVKNSWGRQWGEEGYIRIQKGVAAKEGLCGIAMNASYPIAR